MTADGAVAVGRAAPCVPRRMASGRADRMLTAMARVTEAITRLGSAADELLGNVDPDIPAHYQAAVMAAVTRWRPLPVSCIRALEREPIARDAAGGWEIAQHEWELALLLFVWEAEIITRTAPHGGRGEIVESQDRAAIGFEAGRTDNAEWFGELRRQRIAGPVSTQHRVFPRSISSETLAVHAGTYEDPVTGSVGTPIFQTTTFLLDSASYGAFSDGALRDVPIYTRYGNPSQWSVQEKIAALEGAESALVTSSGMSAIASTIYALTNAGSHIISAYDVYGGTYNLLREDMPSAGREVSFVDPTDLDSIRAAVRPETQLLFFESLTNPLLKVPPIGAIAELAREHNALLVIDNTFLTPVNTRPLSLGADVVVHSATKYLGGHSDLTAGAAVGRRKFLDRIWAQALRFGGTLEPLSCFLLERGIKTLPLRIRTQNENAAAIANFLAAHELVVDVHHPGLGGERYARIEPQNYSGYGGMVSFEVKGGDEAAMSFMANLAIPYVATSLGGVESLVSMPSNTSHSSLTEKQKTMTGINPGLIRFSSGIEHVRDLIDDLQQAFDRLREEGPR